jgi:hypothetical protein
LELIRLQNTVISELQKTMEQTAIRTGVRLDVLESLNLGMFGCSTPRSTGGAAPTQGPMLAAATHNCPGCGVAVGAAHRPHCLRRI